MCKSGSTIKEIWRYPVCSIGGERLVSAAVGTGGIDGDRTHLLVDLDTGEVASPETTPRWRPALMLSACRSGNDVLISSRAWQTMPIGPDLDATLSAFMGFRCGVRPRGISLEQDPSRAVGPEPRYEIAPLHFLTLKSLMDLASLLPDSVIDHRRFRPNLLLDADTPEDGWLGRDWAGGSVTGTVTEKTKRCGFTMVAQPALPEDADILRTIVRQRARCLGVYASVARPGTLSVGDTLLLS